MPDYKTMYVRLFNEVTATIERLQEIQKECENVYIEGNDAPVYVADVLESGE